MFGEKEETLSVNSRALNESTNVVGIFRHRQLDALIDPVKNTEEKENQSGQEHRCGAGRRFSAMRISILI